MSEAVLPRARNAAATKEAILAAARQAFAAQGYDGAGVREIAAAAGVTAMMVNRYFGSKEGLFAEVLARAMADPVILAPETLKSPELAKALAHALVQATSAPPLDGFLIMMRSASNERAAEITRREIEKVGQTAVSQSLRGKGAAQRAAVLLSLLVGVQLMRQAIGLSALVNADPKTLEAILAPVIQALVEES